MKRMKPYTIPAIVAAVVVIATAIASDNGAPIELVGCGMAGFFALLYIWWELYCRDVRDKQSRRLVEKRQGIEKAAPDGNQEAADRKIT